LSDLNGILVVDKPSGWTSHDVVKKTKIMLGGGVKVGHTGTLDPIATGVIVLLIGKSTKLARFFKKDDKRYLAEITFGYSTDTYDRTGMTITTGDPDKVDMEILESAIKSFKGETEQFPPMYSAIKVEGKRLYQLARAGKKVELKPRKIFISLIESVLTDYPKINLDIICSSGTYVRSIADQLGKKVGCPAHLSALRRTMSGKYTIEDSVNFLSFVESSNCNKLKSLIRPACEPKYYGSI